MIAKDLEANKYVIHLVREQAIKFIRLWFTDILGGLKGFTITSDELEDTLEDGRGFDGSTIKGFARTDEKDMIAFPDPATFRVMPTEPQKDKVARIFCDVMVPGGGPFVGDCRYVLKRNLNRAKEVGYTYYVRPEIEYFYFQSSGGINGLEVVGVEDYSVNNIKKKLDFKDIK